ncbi:MAG: acetoin utilization AcuB family protein [Clostridia bacterium]|nr:acetoin utilization AcuB family protein [Clostridia bacterium]
MLVRRIMNKEVVTVSPEMSLWEALNLVKSKGIRHLPVVEEGRLVGIVSDRDLRTASPPFLQVENWDIMTGTLLKQIMHRDVITVHPLESIDEAARLLYEHRIGCLPVLQQGTVVGILTQSDILFALVELMGVTSPGTQIQIEVPDRPGTLADITDIIKANGVNIVSLLTTPGERPAYRGVVIRIKTIDPRKIIQQIKTAGYRVLWPENGGSQHDL